VVEVDRPNRQVRRREGKSDPVDAVVAARAALSGQALGLPKARTGDVEAIRVLMVARRSATSERIAALCQPCHLCFTAHDQVRRRFERLSVAQLTAAAAALRPRPGDTVRYSTLLAMRTLPPGRLPRRALMAGLLVRSAQAACGGTTAGERALRRR